MKHTGTVANPPLGLIAVGPLVEVTLTVHPAEAAQMVVAGKTPPSRIVKMMIDTGAQRTVVEKDIAQQLGLTPTRFQSMVGVSQVPQLCPVYMMSLGLGVSGVEGGVLKSGVVQYSAEVIGMDSPKNAMPHVGLTPLIS